MEPREPVRRVGLKLFSKFSSLLFDEESPTTTHVVLARASESRPRRTSREAFALGVGVFSGVMGAFTLSDERILENTWVKTSPSSSMKSDSSALSSAASRSKSFVESSMYRLNACRARNPRQMRWICVAADRRRSSRHARDHARHAR